MEFFLNGKEKKVLEYWQYCLLGYLRIHFTFQKVIHMGIDTTYVSLRYNY